MRGFLMGLAVVAGVIAVILLSLGGMYNSLVSSEEKVKESWAQVENVYQRRLDLIPNLVQTVKGYAAHERQTLDSVVQARASIGQMKIGADVVNNPEALAQFEKAQAGLSGALSRLLLVAEQYPNLKANENFLALQTQLEGTENRITVERRRFNEMSREFNVKIRIFPSNVLAGMMGFREKAYFQADEGAKAVPKVSF